MKLLILLLSLVSIKSFAAAPSLSDIDAGDFEKLNKEFATNFLHTSVSPASSSKIFGVEVGLVAGITDTPNTKKFTQEIDPSANVDKIANAYLLGTVEIPMGLSFDLGILPETELGDVDLKHLGLAVKWNFFSFAVVDLAAKAHYSSSTLSFEQTVSSVKSNIEIEQKSMGIDLVVSGNFLLIEPYAGVGFVKTDSTIASSASASIFDSTFTTGSTAEDDYSSAKIFVGAQLNLFILHIGLEYMNVHDTDRFSAKLSLYF